MNDALLLVAVPAALIWFLCSFAGHISDQQRADRVAKGLPAEVQCVNHYCK